LWFLTLLAVGVLLIFNFWLNLNRAWSTRRRRLWNILILCRAGVRAFCEHMLDHSRSNGMDAMATKSDRAWNILPLPNLQRNVDTTVSSLSLIPVFLSSLYRSGQTKVLALIYRDGIVYYAFTFSVLLATLLVSKSSWWPFSS
jgi:hypothetical protein